MCEEIGGWFFTPTVAIHLKLYEQADPSVMPMPTSTVGQDMQLQVNLDSGTNLQQAPATHEMSQGMFISESMGSVEGPGDSLQPHLGRFEQQGAPSMNLSADLPRQTTEITVRKSTGEQIHLSRSSLVDYVRAHVVSRLPAVLQNHVDRYLEEAISQRLPTNSESSLPPIVVSLYKY